jgi:hypothetical protein
MYCRDADKRVAGGLGAAVGIHLFGVIVKADEGAQLGGRGIPKRPARIRRGIAKVPAALIAICARITAEKSGKEIFVLEIA